MFKGCIRLRSVLIRASIICIGRAAFTTTDLTLSFCTQTDANSTFEAVSDIERLMIHFAESGAAEIYSFGLLCKLTMKFAECGIDECD